MPDALHVAYIAARDAMLDIEDDIARGVLRSLLGGAEAVIVAATPLGGFVSVPVERCMDGVWREVLP